MKFRRRPKKSKQYKLKREQYLKKMETDFEASFKDICIDLMSYFGIEIRPPDWVYEYGVNTRDLKAPLWRFYRDFKLTDFDLKHKDEWYEE